MIEALNAFIETHADSTWLLPVVLLICILDGILPPAPAEPTLVALGAVAAAEGQPNIMALMAVAAIGGFLGDNLTYTLGRYTRLGRLRESSRPKVRAFVTWISRLLLRRGGMIIIACRYVPGGRQMVNLTAGAMEFPRRRFILFDGLAVTTWAAYNVGIGALAGSWLEEQPLLGVLVALIAALVLGWLVERGVQWWRDRSGA
ncbi:DedA family protein [Ornithinimicrobium pratense]|uniref:DedA family protein n=1 Tax=Ornithinimicrobium pratense TaxID=2593973 RepID=A0A5J6V4T1_9MICO|nr:VTT domain-containing protein [Ornithinimicrobium pratense]QFG68082.1 DedA family protein [Ornithinimicrobium pratense]